MDDELLVLEILMGPNGMYAVAAPLVALVSTTPVAQWGGLASNGFGMEHSIHECIVLTIRQNHVDLVQ